MIKSIITGNGEYINISMIESAEIIIEKQFERFYIGRVKLNMLIGNIYYILEDYEGDPDILHERMEEELLKIMDIHEIQ